MASNSWDLLVPIRSLFRRCFSSFGQTRSCLALCAAWKVSTGAAVSTSLLAATLAWSEPVPGSLDVHGNEGASDCSAAPQDPLQIHKYEPQTFTLRQSPCADFEANFIYLLLGSDKALLIDTGAVANPKAMPLAKTILELLPDTGDRQNDMNGHSGGRYVQRHLFYVTYSFARTISQKRMMVRNGKSSQASTDGMHQTRNRCYFLPNDAYRRFPGLSGIAAVAAWSL
jgi:hypothetical protein